MRELLLRIWVVTRIFRPKAIVMSRFGTFLIFSETEHPSFAIFEPKCHSESNTKAGKRPCPPEGSPIWSSLESGLPCWNLTSEKLHSAGHSPQRSLKFKRFEQGDSSGRLFLSPPRLGFRNDTISAKRQRGDIFFRKKLTLIIFERT